MEVDAFGGDIPGRNGFHLFHMSCVKSTLSPASRFSPEYQRPPANGRPQRRRPKALPDSLPLRVSASQGTPGVSLARRRSVGGAVERTGAAVPASVAPREQDRRMAALGSPARTLRGLLRELRYLNAATGRPYRDTAAYRYLVKAFRAHRVRKPRPCPGKGRLVWVWAG